MPIALIQQNNDLEVSRFIQYKTLTDLNYEEKEFNILNLFYIRFKTSTLTPLIFPICSSNNMHNIEVNSENDNPALVHFTKVLTGYKDIRKSKIKRFCDVKTFSTRNHSSICYLDELIDESIIGELHLKTIPFYFFDLQNSTSLERNPYYYYTDFTQVYLLLNNTGGNFRDLIFSINHPKGFKQNPTIFENKWYIVREDSEDECIISDNKFCPIRSFVGSDIRTLNSNKWDSLSIRAKFPELIKYPSYFHELNPFRECALYNFNTHKYLEVLGILERNACKKEVENYETRVSFTPTCLA